MTERCNYTKIVLSMLCAFFIGSSMLGQDTIPFTLGNDNRIYIKVRVNNSEPLDFIFDTGAASMVANTTKTNQKLSLNFDGSVANRGANGITRQPTSSGNTLQIGDFKRTNEELLGIEYPAQHYSFDGVIGYPFFEEYITELDYKQQQMIIHKETNTIAALDTFEPLIMNLIENVPFVDMVLYKKEVPVTVPVMVDTGFNGELIVYYKMVRKHKLANQFPQKGTSASEGTDGSIIRSNRVFIPKVTLGSIEFEDLPAYFNQTPSPTSFTAILGGEILKHIHWVFDFKNSTVYVKTNGTTQ